MFRLEVDIGYGIRFILEVTLTENMVQNPLYLCKRNGCVQIRSLLRVWYKFHYGNVRKRLCRLEVDYEYRSVPTGVMYLKRLEVD